MSRLPLSFDTAQLLHLVGPALYADALAFLDELLRNSYNADAQLIRLNCVAPGARQPLERLEILDDGHGMDPDEVRRYFITVGTNSARCQPYSPGGRRKMGGHGIGRFAAFAVCDRVEVYTRRAEGPLSVVRLERGTLFADPPMSRVDVLPTVPADVPLERGGTYFRLSRFSRPLRREQVVRRVLSRFTRDFFAHIRVEVDGKRLAKRWPEPHRLYRLPEDFPPEALHGLPSSVVGELVYVDNAQQLLPEEVGLALTVGGTTIRVERFGQTAAPRQSLHLTGWVAVDHLRELQDASRTGFQVHAPEYLAVERALHRAAAVVCEREEQRSQRLADSAEAQALQMVLEQIIQPLRQALGDRAEVAVDALAEAPPRVPRPRQAALAVSVAEDGARAEPRPGRSRPDARKAAPRRRRGPPLLVTAACLGGDQNAPEAVLDGDSLLLNIEHPVYRQARTQPASLAYHCARLVTQHLALRMAPPMSGPAEVFGLQSDLLGTVLAGSRKGRQRRVA